MNINREYKIVGNFLSENKRNEDNVIFLQDSKWAGGYILFMHAVRDKEENIIVWNGTKYTTPNGTFFAMKNEDFDEISVIAAEFEESIRSN